MAIKLSEGVRAALEDETTVKILGTADAHGVPHLAVKESLRLRPDGLIDYREYIESSTTNRNMTASIWFGVPVSLCLVSGKRSFLVKGKVVRAVISGREFRQHYEDVRQLSGDLDLSTVWIIEPDFEQDTTLCVRKEEEEKAHPLLQHVDRLLVEQVP